MQVDGEPVLLEASEILIEKKNQANMIISEEAKFDKYNCNNKFLKFIHFSQILKTLK